MSILQDLDPKYAKIHTRSSFAGWKSITWIFSLLLILLWASWLAFTLQNNNSASENNRTGSIAQDQGSPSVETVKAPSLASSQTSMTSPANTPPASIGGGSAIIQEARNQDSAKSEKAPESVPFPSMTAEVTKPVKSDQTAKPASTEKTAQQKTKLSTVHAAERKQTNKAHAEKNSQPSTKKASERDIDIITAIVR